MGRMANVRVLCALAAASAGGIGLAATGWAQAQMPNVGQAQPHVPPVIRQPGQIPPIATDLSCSITASYDQAGQKPFQNGAFLASGGVTGSEWLHVTVVNSGPITATNFQVAVQASGAASYSNTTTTYTLTLAANGSQTLHRQIMTNGPGSFQVTVGAQVDTANKVVETSKNNNSCSFQYRVENVA